MDKIKELWARLVAWAQSNPAIAIAVGIGALVVGVFAYKRFKRRAAQRRSARRARNAKKRKRSRR